MSFRASKCLQDDRGKGKYSMARTKYPPIFKTVFADASNSHTHMRYFVGQRKITHARVLAVRNACGARRKAKAAQPAVPWPSLFLKKQSYYLVLHPVRQANSPSSTCSFLPGNYSCVAASSHFQLV